MIRFPSKKPSETATLQLNFFSLFTNSTEAIQSAVWSVTVASGTDVNPSLTLPNLSGSFSQGVASNFFTGGVVGVQYIISCTITTSLGQTLTQNGIISVASQAGTEIIGSRQDLADYCLRKLGGGVINVEVSDEQVNDCLDDAIQYYHEYHFDGIERDYLVYQIQGSSITVANPAVFSGKGDTVMSMDNNTSALIAKVNGNTLSTNRQIGIIKFQVGDTVKSSTTGGTTTITGITLSDPDNGYIQIDPSIVGVKRLLNITSILGSSDYMFNVQYQIMMSEIQNLTSAGTAYFYSVQQFLGHLDFIMKKEKDFRFNRRMDRLYLDIQWTNDVRVGDVVVAEVYRALDPEQFPRVYQDIWLRRYTTALIKKQLGQNLRKYQNMQLPGGVTFNGQVILDEALNEIKDLEAEAIYSTSPLEFMVG